MSDVIAGIEIPDSEAIVESTRLATEMMSPLLFHHSRRVFLLGTLQARRLGLDPDPELLYLSAMFHDAGLLTPYSTSPQRFELDGADHARRFLTEHGFSDAAAETVWLAVALHSTPGIPRRMGPEIAATNLGVLTDATGMGLDLLPSEAIEEIVAAHPRGDFKQQFLHAFYEGLKDRPETAYGTVNADVLEHFLPGYSRGSMVERVLDSPWPN